MWGKPLENLGFLIEEVSVLIIADLHLGYEDVLREEGLFVASQYPKMKEMILEMINEHSPDVLVVNGDFKHEFGEASLQEWVEVRDLIETLLKERVRLVFVRGNHDNFIVTLMKRYGLPLESEVKIEDYLFLHGHRPPSQTAEKIVIGHEHPSILLRDEFGTKFRYKAFLMGSYAGRELAVLPSMHPLATGTVVNREPAFISPLLTFTDIEEFTPYLVEPGITVKKFPKIKNLRNI
ncbi:MAG: metallophosphoesterase [Candidatus Freyarchaeota archaeon]|nr:metallophosphoesterase [Candidatus Jordarchaeia archaeon]